MNCVHLDFHTGPLIPDIGVNFDKAAFTKAVKEAHVDLMTVFAKCHHGYTYYPSRIDPMHPNLKFNLLKEQLEAIRAAGAKAPIYITIGWSKRDADEHPEWHQIDFKTKKPLYYGSAPAEDDTPETLQLRIMQEAEWKILPEAVRLFCDGRIEVRDNKVFIK